MGVSIQDRTDFLNMLDACRTEQQLFSRLTFAVMFHQTDPDAREDLLDDVRGAACSMQLPAVNYKIDQWLNTCKQAWQADPAAFMAAVNADAKQRKCAGGSAVAARTAGRCAHAERGVAGAAAAAAGRSVAAGCRRRHRQGHLAGTAHCLCDGGQDLRLFSAAAAADRQGAAACGRGRPRQGAQGPSAGGRGRHEPGAGADRRRLLWQDRPAPYPQGPGTGGFCRQGRAAAAHRGPAAELSARRCGDGKPQPDAQCPAAAARHCRKAGLRGAHRDALQQKSRAFPAAHVWPTARISGTWPAAC